MKSFISSSIYFTLGYLVINALFYFLVTIPAVYQKYVFNESDMSNYHTFLVSDSHGACMKGIPNDYGIYNFSYRGDNYLDMYLKVKYLSTKLTEKDTILINVDSHLSSSYRGNSSNIKKNIVYSNYEISALQESIDIKIKLNNKKYFKYLPLLDVDYGVFYYDYLLPEKVSAYHRSFADYSEITQQIKCQRRYETQYLDKKKSIKQEKYLELIINTCKEKKITLVGLKYPIAKKYWEMIGHHEYDIDQILDRNDIEVFDFHDLFFDNTEYFYDQDHMNSKGSRVLCKQIKSRPKYD